MGTLRAIAQPLAVMAVRIALRVLDNGQLMFQADQVAEPRDGTPRTEKIPKLMLIIQRDGVPVDVVVDVLFVGVRADEKGVLAFEKTGRKLIADAVCFFRCDLAGLERLANLVQDHAAVLRPSGKLRILALRKQKFRVGGVPVAGVGCDKRALSGLLRVQTIAGAVRQHLRDGLTFVDVHGNNTCGRHRNVPPSGMIL